MESYIVKVVKRLRKEVPRRFKELRNLCDELIASLGQGEKANVLDVMSHDGTKYLQALIMSCETHHPRLTEIALDAFHYFIEHGYLKGSASSESTTSSSDGTGNSFVISGKQIMDKVIDTISKCSDEYDETVQLQVIKALLTAITSLNCEVHDASLLLSVRACFHIHLMSRNAAIKVAAKAALTQMVSVINQRMELHDTHSQSHALSHSNAASPPVHEGSTGVDVTDNSNTSASSESQGVVREINRATSMDDTAAIEAAIDEASINESDQHLVDFSNLPTNSSNVLDIDGAGEGDEQQPQTDEGSKGDAAIVRPTVDNAADNSATANASNSSGSASNDFISVYHRDAYLLFRALCKLSMKGVADDNQAGYSDNIVLQNKLLSLELIYHLLHNCGPAFRYGARFIYAIRTFLCVSLLNNCTSQLAQVTGLSLQIFVLLIQNFKEHLKGEVEVFVSTIFLRILESENSTFEHKQRVLEVFHSIVKDPMGQIELFINYDCDIDAINLFSRIVTAFSKISKNPSIAGTLGSRIAVEFMSSNNKRSQQEELQIRAMGLEGLVIILRSLVVAAGLSNAANYNVNNNTYNSNANTNSNNSSGQPGVNRSNSVTGISFNNDEDDETPNTVTSPVLADQQPVTSPGTEAITSSTHNSSSSSFNAVEVFDKKQKLQQEIDTGIVKFNLNPMKGVKYLVAMQHLVLEPGVVAKFLLEYQDRLDKTAVGDLLGREKDYEGGFCYRVLHEYVEQLDFSVMQFDKAMRLFLSGFRLPGEAQKIDRIMEKFAERYYLQHQDEFASADMAFILAFSTIMLQTNLHNPAVREDKRMTKEQFIKQNKGISSDGELSDDLLSSIYDRIAAEPFTLTDGGISGGGNNRKGKAVGVKDDSSSSGAFIVFQGLSERKKKDAFNHERKEMLKIGEEMIRQTRKRNSLFIKNNAPERVEQYIRAMFEIVWPSALAVFSQILETFDETSLIQQCILGFQLSILLACRLDYNIARNTFINALYKFTTLDSVREMKSKNIACIKLILTVALSEGEYLEESWTQVLTNISQLSRLLLFASGIHSDELYFNSDHGSNSSNSRRGSQPTARHADHLVLANHTGGSNGAGSFNRSSFNSGAGSSNNNSSSSSSSALDPFTKLFMGPSKAEVNRLVEESNADLIVRDIDPLLLDKIYQNSVSLSGPAVVHFVTSLCEVSMQEISSSSTMNTLRYTANNSEPGNNSSSSSSYLHSTGNSASARVFSLQKLVEVADCNMNLRSRMDWAKIWSLLNNHFSVIGVSDNLLLSMYAIDSLKQLSIKFLQKDELSNFNFQRIFLKPFEQIILKSHSSDTKDLVLRCINIMIKTCANNIRSGWRSIFNIFTIAAQQEDGDIAKLAFDITEQLMNEQFSLLVFDFVELMNCLVSFSSAAQHTSLSLRALSYLLHCADHLAAGIVPTTSAADALLHATHDHLPTGSNSSGNSGSVLEKKVITISTSNLTDGAPLVVDDDHAVFRLWWPLLLGLSTRVSDHRLAVRLKALDTLQTILKKHGQLFSSQAWLVIFKGVLFPMMDSAKTDGTEQPRSVWPTQNPPMATSKESWIGTMALSVLNTCVELYQMFRENEQTLLLLPDLLHMIEDTILQETESLARMGARVLRDLVFSVGHAHQLPANVTANGSNDGDAREVEAQEVLLLDKNHVDHVIQATCYSLTKNLCLDFQDAGHISLHLADCAVPLPPAAQSTATVEPDDEQDGHADIDTDVDKDQCPLALRRRNKSTTINHNAHTSSSSSSSGLIRQNSSGDSSARAGQSVNWKEFGPAVMTCLVLSLDLIKIAAETAHKYQHTLQLAHHRQLLHALEAGHWHAHLFNDNVNLRLKLQQRNFMSKKQHNTNNNSSSTNNNSNNKLARTLPHLLDQEVLSLETILRIVYSLYTCDHDRQTLALQGLEQSRKAELSVAQASFEDRRAFIQPWLEKYAAIALTRYLSLEEHDDDSNNSDNSDNDFSDEEPAHRQSHAAAQQAATASAINSNSNSSAVLVDLQFARERHNYYLSPALIVLQHTSDGSFTREAFHANRRWLGPLLTRLVKCENKQVRLLVMHILQRFVDPLFADN